MYIIESIFQSLDNPPFIIEALSTLTFSLVNYFILLIASSVANYKLVVKDSIWKIGMIIGYFLSAIIEFMVYRNRINSEFQDVHVMILDMMTLFAGLMLIYAFLRTPFVIRGFETNQTRGLWIAIGLLLSLIGSLRIWNELGDVMDLLFSVDLKLPPFLDSNDTIDYLIFGIAFFVIILALFYPETMLLSQTQVTKVAKFLNSMDINNWSDFNNVPTKIGNKNSILRYLKEVKKLIREDWTDESNK